MSDAAYISGFIDGEGCLHALRRRLDSGVVSYLPAIIVVNTDRRPLDFIAERYDCRLVEGRRSGPRTTKRWDLKVIGATRVWPLLTDIAPYLIAKREEGELLFDLCELVDAGGQHEERAEIAARLSALKSRARYRRTPVVG